MLVSSVQSAVVLFGQFFLLCLPQVDLLFLLDQKTVGNSHDSVEEWRISQRIGQQQGRSKKQGYTLQKFSRDARTSACCSAPSLGV